MYIGIKNIANYDALAKHEWVFENAFFNFEGLIWNTSERVNWTDKPLFVDDFAGNDTTLGVLNIGGVTNGSIEDAGDDDWFAFTASANQIYHFSLSNTDNAANMTFTLFDNISISESSTNGSSIGVLVEFSGVFYISVSGDAPTDYSITTTLSNDDYANESFGASAFDIGGGDVSGRIDYTQSASTNGDEDWFVFTVATSSTIAFSLTTEFATELVSLQVFDQSNNILGASQSDGEVSLQFLAGTYFVAVSSSVVTDYSFSTTVIGDDYSADINTTGVLVINGAPTNGSIEASNDVDWIAVTVEAGIQYNFSVSGENGFSDFSFDLLDSNGQFVGEPALSTDFTHTFTTAGVYYLSVTAGTTVDYTVSATTTTDDFGQAAATSGVLNIGGASISASINYADDQDWFAITVSADQQVLFDLSQELTLQLFGADEIALNEEIQSNFLLYTFSEAGTYYFSASSTSAQDYTLSARSINEIAGDSSTTTEIILDGASVESSLDFDRDEDWLEFTLEPGQIVRFESLVNDPSFQHRILVVDETYSNGGMELAEGSTFAATGTASVIFYSELGGTFYLVLDGFADEARGSYSVSATEIFDTVGNTPQTASVINLDNTTISGTLEYNGDVDWYGFTIEQAGQTIPFRAGADTVFFDVALRIYDANGDLLFTAVDVPSFASYTFDSAGSYYISVSAEFSTGFRLSADYANDISTLGTITLDGTEYVGSLAFDNGDWYAFEITAATLGDIFRFEVEGDGATYGLAIYDVNGNMIVDRLSDTQNSEYLSHLFDEAGTYYIGVTSAGTSSSFTLSAHEVFDEIAGDVTTTGTISYANGRVSSSLDYENDSDWFEITLEAGDHFQVEIQNSNISFLVMTFYDANGVELETANDAVDVTVLVSGTYYIGVTGGGQNSTGDYTLSLTQAWGFSNGSDNVDGTGGGDFLNGLAGNDTIHGAGGNDKIDGGAGADRLFGDSGNDILFGGSGDDELTGGTGADRFVILNDDGNDRIMDFEHGIDVIEFGDGSYSFDALNIFQDGANVIIKTSGGTLTLVGIDLSTIDASDFSFRLVPAPVPDTTGAEKIIVSEPAIIQLEKPVVADVEIADIDGNALNQDLVAEFLTQVPTLRALHIDAEFFMGRYYDDYSSDWGFFEIV